MAAPFKKYFRAVGNRELIFIGLCLLLVFVFSFFNFQRAYVRARDVQRKNDLKHIAAGLSSYAYDFGFYPLSKNGEILACGSPEHLRVCGWGADPLQDISDLDYPPYLSTLPNDPQQSSNKARYKYISNMQNYQLFASLENKNEDEFDQKIYLLELDCGGRICNFMVTSNKNIKGILDENSRTEELPNEK